MKYSSSRITTWTNQQRSIGYTLASWTVEKQIMVHLEAPSGGHSYAISLIHINLSTHDSRASCSILLFHGYMTIV